MGRSGRSDRIVRLPLPSASELHCEGVSLALGQVDHHVLDLGVFQQRVPAPLPPVAAQLGAAEGRADIGRPVGVDPDHARLYLARHPVRSEERTSELQSLMRISYAVFCLKTQTYTI